LRLAPDFFGVFLLVERRRFGDAFLPDFFLPDLFFGERRFGDAFLPERFLVERRLIVSFLPDPFLHIPSFRLPEYTRLNPGEHRCLRRRRSTTIGIRRFCYY